ncbi:MAG: hydroxypyruvate isomerase family protein [Planctomycetota bacterium]
MSDTLRNPSIQRRQLLQGIGAGAVASLTLGPATASRAADAPARKGRIRQAACPGAFGRKTTIEDKCKMAKELGLYGIDLVDVKDWGTLKQYGLICTMARSHSLTKGLNRKEQHDECIALIRESIEAAAAAGFPNVICFPGNRDGLDDETGLVNSAEGLKKVVGFAEEKNITLCMELLNSKLNHKDYQCDRTHWGVELCKRVGSPRFKLLYDIYHMQVQEGDIIATIRESIDYIAHIHTAGVPGRHEIDETQELYYPAIMRAIADLNYGGYVAHEYSPVQGDAKASLQKAIEICDV